LFNKTALNIKNYKIKTSSEFILRFFVRDETLILGATSAQINVRRGNEKSFGPRDINTKFNDRRYSARRKVWNIIAIWPGRRIAPRWNFIKSTFGEREHDQGVNTFDNFMPVLVQGEHIGGFNAT